MRLPVISLTCSIVIFSPSFCEVFQQFNLNAEVGFGHLKRLCLWALIFCVLAGPACAHPGMTDSKGGHWDRSTGEYHYHDGSSAGQEKSQSSYTHSNTTPLPWQEKNTGLRITSGKTYSRPLLSKDDWALIGNLLVFLGPWVALIVYSIVTNVKEKKEKEQNEEKKEQERLFYAAHSLKELSNMPDGIEIGEDGLPRPKGYQHWGDEFTRYCSSASSNKFHSSRCRYAYAKFHVMSEHQHYIHCSLCNPEPLPSKAWFISYKKHKKICEENGYTPKPDE